MANRPNRPASRSSPSGVAQDQAFRRWGRGEYDHDAEMAESTDLFRTVRRTMLVGIALVAVIMIALMASGSGTAAGEAFAIMGAPLVIVLAGTEIAKLVWRRVTR